MKTLAILLFLLPLTVKAEYKVPATWIHLVKRLMLPANFNDDTRFYQLKNISSPDQAKTSQRDYLAAVSMAKNQDGTIVPVIIVNTSERWTSLADGGWDIDQWVHTTNTTGALLQVRHKHQQEDRDGQVILVEDLHPARASDPNEIAIWNQIQQRWYDWDQANP